MKVLSCFSGLGAFEKALSRQNIEYQLVNYCEINKYASKSYSLIHNVSEELNLGDITKVNEKKLSDFDLIMGGSPCQDFSIAGKQEGAKWTCKECKHEYNPLEAHYTTRDKCPKCNSINIEKTRSSLLAEWLRILREKLPKYGIYENVKNIIGKKFKQTFDLFEKELNEYGYNTYWKVLNAKDYGVPQNRERVYLIIIRKDIDDYSFQFPEGFDNGIRLKDLLEENVDEKYYISQEKTDKLIEQLKNKEISNTVRSGGRGSLDRHSWDLICVDNQIQQVGMLDIKGNEQIRRVYNPEGISPTLNSMQGGSRQPKILEDFYSNRDIREYEDYSPTLRADRQGLKVKIEYRIRKLTPLECMLLMDFDKEDYYKLKENKISNSQIYKMAGNSIVVNVLKGIFNRLLK